MNGRTIVEGKNGDLSYRRWDSMRRVMIGHTTRHKRRNKIYIMGQVIGTIFNHTEFWSSSRWYCVDGRLLEGFFVFFFNFSVVIASRKTKRLILTNTASKYVDCNLPKCSTRTTFRCWVFAYRSICNFELLFITVHYWILSVKKFSTRLHEVAIPFFNEKIVI